MIVQARGETKPGLTSTTLEGFRVSRACFPSTISVTHFRMLRHNVLCQIFYQCERLTTVGALEKVVLFLLIEPVDEELVVRIDKVLVVLFSRGEVLLTKVALVLHSWFHV